MKKTSIIIVNYKGYELLESCIKALNEQTTKDFEVVIVDNASVDDSAQKIKELIRQYKDQIEIKFIASNENLGFSNSPP